MCKKVLFYTLVVVFFYGCKTGVSVSLKDSSGINVGSITFEESTWPIVSYRTGPDYRFWVREKSPGIITVDGFASLTNSTSALGIYQSDEGKAITIKMSYDNRNSGPQNGTEIDEN